MSLLLDDMRAEFARFLATDPAARFRMDAALAHVVTLAYRAGMADAAQNAAPASALVTEFTSPDAVDWILGEYIRLHRGKIGQHWLWAAIERLNTGDPEVQVLADFGYVPERPRHG